MDLSRRLRSTALIFVLFTLLVDSSYSRYHGKRHKRQNGAHLYHPETFIVPEGDGDNEEWGQWSSPSECSRSCGGGVAFQTRECLRFAPNGSPLCRGGNRKYFSCNTQDCPEEEPDFRVQQCSRFNTIPFEGVRYEWVPYTKAPNPCELNCMPRGERFYYRHKAKVIDGTRCNDESLNVCVNGKCQAVGCDMMLGSSAREDKCRKCAGDGTSCKTVSGIFDQNNLQVGYNDILLIPAGATNIAIQEIAPSNNYLACRNLTSHYYLNGNWRIDFPRPMLFAGSWWHYERKPQGFAAPDHLSCIGPTTESIYLVLLYQDRNVGIKYEYSIPESVVRSTPDTYTWSQTEFGPCSVSCGGGQQTRTVTCNSRITLDTVDESLCDTNTRPSETQLCGQDECAPHWVEGQWGKCSKSCGEDGKQNRTITCERVSSNGIATVVEDSICLNLVGNKPADIQECNRDVENCPKYHTGPWTPCDQLCGEGKQKRKVTCYREVNGKKKILNDSECDDEKPATENECMLAPCEGVDWITSQWSGCKNCGQTKESRTASCASKSGKVYDEKFCSEDKPELSQECKSSACNYQWFTSQWSKCSAECGEGVQSRIVICGKFDGLSVTPAEDDKNCDAAEKPLNEQECEGAQAECPGLWFTGPWEACSKPCGGGERIREVLCLANGTASSNCDETQIEFASEKCNLDPCEEDETIPVESTGKTIESDEDTEYECEEDGLDIGSELIESVSTESPSKINEKLQVAVGVELDAPGASTEPSLLDDELMYSDATGLETESTDSSTDIPETTVEGSGDDSTIITVEGSGDDQTTLSVDSSAFTEETTIGTSADSSSTDDVSSTSSDASTEASSSLQTDASGSTDSTGSSEGTTATTSLASSESTDASSSSSLSSDTSESTTVSVDNTSGSTTSSDITDTTTEVTTETTTDSSSSSSDSSSPSSSSLSTDGSTTAASTDDTTVTSTDSSTIASSSSSDSSTDASTIDITDASTDSSSHFTDVSGSTEVSDSTTDASTDASWESSTVAESEETSTSSSDGPTVEETTVSGATDETTVSGSTDASSTEASEATVSSEFGTTGSTESTVDSSTASSIVDETTVDIWASTSEAATEESSDGFETTPNTLEAAISKETTPRKCIRRQKKKTDCKKTEFGCCPDDKTTATGPFDKGCPIAKTCKDTKFGCCLDGISPAQGKANEGCPKSQCAETLFGCCPDKFTSAEGEDNEGCPEPTTLPPPTTTPAAVTEVSEDDFTESTSESVVSSEAPGTEKSSEIEKSCSFSEFGCCPDGKIAAQGDNFKGCDITDEKNCENSIYGCCPDKKASATGPDGEGCATCTREPFGCCPDGTTPAHGFNHEGCCAKSEFGCCPDNVNAARGPYFKDCDCNYAPYGCCPDNKTIAYGPEFKGCNCDLTKFGCCPDKLTPATGPKFEGCPCHTMQFGCCPDGVTIPQGANHYGCHCSQTEHKCCSDNVTPAKGPNYEGCTCAESKFGCCPDGVTEAQGRKFEECEDVKEVPQKACALPKETGACGNYSVKYFFDTTYGACARFWYGGCDGNGNRFNSAEDCKATCEDYKGKESCLLPKSSGPCPGFHKKFYFDADRNRCEEFNYGGCFGNTNRYETLQECQNACSVDDSIPPCEQPMETGPCQGNFERWFYDNETDVCTPFVYGGCKGNKNNYVSESACNYHCKEPGVHKDYCDLPIETGNCNGSHARWHYSDTDRKCMPFYYTGCGGNKNNFRTLEQCEQHCPKPIAKDICEIPAEVGECQNYVTRWYFDTKDTRCRQFYYGGCGGNENNFADEVSCNNRCEKKPEPVPEPEPERKQPAAQVPSESSRPKVGKCFAQQDPGNCDQYTYRWFYNSATGICENFAYGGCGGNENNFESEQDCESNCGHVQNTCSLPAVRGRCNDNLRRWHFDERSGRCHEFEFGGCQGNKNNFVTEKECISFCSSDGSNEDADYSQCDLPMAVGNCSENALSWFYNANNVACEAFYYTGCDGNGNRFESEEQCHRQCGEYRGIDVCNEPVETGPCNQWVTRFSFNQQTKTCDPFTYGGCEGTGNRFIDRVECESVCIVHEEPTPVDNKEYCKLPAESGRCVDHSQPSRRWYYDDSRGTCVPFIYTGCSGNLNNFRSFESCIDLCANNEPANVATEATPVVDNVCAKHEEECQRIRCPYGIRKSYTQEKCEKCDCANPCAQQSCPEGQQCAVDIDPASSTGDSFVAVCRDQNKPGECPPLANGTKCDRECYTDADCRGDNKCCSDGCGFVCVRPYQHREEVTTAGPREPVLYPGDVAAVLEEKPQKELEHDTPAGEMAVLRCFAAGYPAPVITWRRGGIIIDTNQGRYVLTSSGDLTIVRVQQTDNGTYVCIADNGLGEPVHREITLRVQAVKKTQAYIAGPRNETRIVTLGHRVEMRCPAGGEPTPFVVWWRGSERLPLTSARYEFNRDHSLVYPSIALSDLGPYSCDAYSGHGRPASIQIILKTVGPLHVTNPDDRKYLKYVVSPALAPATSKPAYPFRPTRPPYRVPPPVVYNVAPVADSRVAATALIRRDPSNTYMVSTDIVLYCDVGGSPAPNVTWTKDETALVASSRIAFTQNPYRLVIYAATAADTGYYGCTARNSFSYNTNQEKISIESGVYLHPDCVDSSFFANCGLIVKGRYCSNKYYAKFCCRSCTLAGQLTSAHPNSLQFNQF